VSFEIQKPTESNSRRPRIGLFIIASDPYWIQATEAIIHTCEKLGDELIILQPAISDEGTKLIPTDELVDQILAYELDVLLSNYSGTPLILTLIAEGLSVVCLSEINYHHPRFTAISSLYEGGKIAGEYIAKRLKGRGHALCITAGLVKILTTGQTRMAGFYDALQPYPDISIEHFPAYWNYAQAYPALLSSLKDYPRQIDAIFGASDTLILAARDAGRKLGVIDQHTILVGLNGDPAALAAIAEGDLSATVDTASENVGAEGAEAAHRAALGLPQPDVITHRFQLITKENVASVATRKMIALANMPAHMVGFNRGRDQDRLTQLEISMEITQQIGSLQNRERVIQVTSELVNKEYGYEWMRILRWSQEEQSLVLYGGSPSPISKQMPIEQDWMLNHAFRSNEVIYIADTLTSRRWRLGSEWAPVRSRALLPILLGSKVIGILDLQSSQPVRQPNLEIVGLKLLASQIGIVIQNTDLYLDAVQARETAERANQLKNRLMANVGHEMRTPLNAILGFSQSIQKRVDQGQTIPLADLQGDIRHIYNSSEHLMYMINDLLDLSRAEIGALSLYFEQIQMGAFLKEVFDSFTRAQPANPAVTWNLQVPLRLPVIRADGVRLRQIVVNLLVNAQKFTQRGSVTLGAAVEPPYLHLWLSDTGPGVPIELQEKIFEPFAVIARKRRPEGIGLGLSITRHLVALHEGVITLESQPGSGSTFHIYLPLPGIAQEPAVSVKSGDVPAMLIISSRSELPGELKQICDRQHLTPYLIACREDLDRMLYAGKPAVVAWDLAHASPIEWSLIQQLSSKQDCAALPLILYGLEENDTRLDAGLTHVVFKPCSANTLKEWVDQAVPNMEASESILVVDDDPQAREFYLKILEKSQPHRRILQAENGVQALKILKSEVPGLILLDLMMPEVNGFAVLESIRGDDRLLRIPVIVISGKLLSYEDVQRLNYMKTTFLTKGILNGDETTALLAQVQTEGLPSSQSTSVLIKQVLAYLHTNYSHPINRKDIAEAVGVSENYLSQIFRQETSLSPWDYLNRFRVQKAKELLVHTDETITTVATRVGYNDSAYFSRVFRKVTGVSPQDFRKTA
jgi:signal transduction histidine kinase/AraC-like DNA-binding protein/DNA-binding LacI/PurR family transcriptional regulator